MLNLVQTVLKMKAISALLNRELCKTNCVIETKKVTGNHGWVLGYLYLNSGKDIYQRDIEKVSNLRRSTITSFVDNFEKKGLIKREADTLDARKKKLILTQKGLDTHLGLEKGLSDGADKIFSGVTEKELATFNIVLNKMKRNLEE